MLSILLSISILHAVLSLAITESLSIEFLFRGVLILWCMSVCLRSFVTRASQVRGVCRLGVCGGSGRIVVLVELECQGIVEECDQKGRDVSFLFLQIVGSPL